MDLRLTRVSARCRWDSMAMGTWGEDESCLAWSVRARASCGARVEGGLRDGFDVGIRADHAKPGQKS